MKRMTHYLDCGRVSAAKILAVLAVGFFIAWSALSVKKVNDIKAPVDGTIKEEETCITGLRYKTCRNGRLVARIDAEEFKIRPRRFFVFQIKSLNEAIITNAKMDLFFRKEAPHGSLGQEGGDGPFGALLRDLTNKESGVGLVTKVTLKGIDISIYDSDVLTQRLRADSADLRSDTGQGIFYKATLEEPSIGKFTVAPKVVWDPHKKKFKAQGYKSHL